MHNGVRKAVNCLKEEQEDRRGSLDQTVFPDTAALKECLKGVNWNEDGYYTVSTLAEMAYVLRKLQEEKARQEAAEERRKRGK